RSKRDWSSDVCSSDLYEAFDDAEAALAYVRTAPCPVVVKADGLALGKGVLICETNAQAEAAVTEMMRHGKFGASGSRVVVEAFRSEERRVGKEGMAEG